MSGIENTAAVSDKEPTYSTDKHISRSEPIYDGVAVRCIIHLRSSCK